MKLPDPINNKGAPGFSLSTLTSVSPVIQDQMPNSKVLTVSQGEQYWQVTLEYSDLLVSEYNMLNAQIDKAILLGEPLEVWLPQYEDYTFKQGSTLVDKLSEYSFRLPRQGSRSLPKLGNIIQFSNHSKVYRITGVQVDQDYITIEFFPTLRKPLLPQTTVKFTGVYFTLEFVDRSNPIQTTPFTQDGFYSQGVTLELRETQ